MRAPLGQSTKTSHKLHANPIVELARWISGRDTSAGKAALMSAIAVILVVVITIVVVGNEDPRPLSSAEWLDADKRPCWK